MHKFRMSFRLIASVALMATSTISNGEPAPLYPSRPITIVVPAPPGGVADGQIRALSVPLARALKQPIIVDNRAGAGGVIGTGLVARAPADGYTLLYAGDSHAISPLLFKLPYDPNKDFVAVAPLSISPLILITAPNVNVRTVPDLIALGKSRPDALSYASTGTGSPSQLAAEMFKTAAGIEMNHIPYKGGAAAINDVMSGQVQVMLIGAGTALQQIKAGKVKALAVTSKERLPGLPDVPTLASYLPNFEAIAWGGLLAPVGTPSDIVVKLNTEIGKALNSSEVRAYMEMQAMTPFTATPDEYKQFIQREARKSGAIVKSLNIKVE